MFKVTVFRKSSNEKSYVVGIRAIEETPMGTSEVSVGVGYIKNEKEVADGTVFNWNGNVQFIPIADRDGIVATTKNGEIKHQVALVAANLPFIAPTTEKPTVSSARPAVIEEQEEVDAEGNPVPKDDDQPF